MNTVREHVKSGLAAVGITLLTIVGAAFIAAIFGWRDDDIDLSTLSIDQEELADLEKARLNHGYSLDARRSLTVDNVLVYVHTLSHQLCFDVTVTNGLNVPVTGARLDGEMTSPDGVVVTWTIDMRDRHIVPGETLTFTDLSRHNAFLNLAQYKERMKYNTRTSRVEGVGGEVIAGRTVWTNGHEARLEELRTKLKYQK